MPSLIPFQDRIPANHLPANCVEARLKRYAGSPQLEKLEELLLK